MLGLNGCRVFPSGRCIVYFWLSQSLIGSYVLRRNPAGVLALDTIATRIRVNKTPSFLV